MSTPQATAERPPVADSAFQRCINPDCDSTFAVSETLVGCPNCDSLLDVRYDWDRLPVPQSLREFEARWSNRRNPLDFSGVWRFRDLLPFAPEDQIVTIGEGQTMLRSSDRIARYIGVDEGNAFLQYEGLNPSGSFKDNGMTAASTHAKMVGAKFAACASTGNTSASLAVYSSAAGAFQVVVLIGDGRISQGKLSQALDYGALTLQVIDADFDDVLKLAREMCRHAPIYLCNSVNPFRLEGQKTIMLRVLEGLNWETPDWVVVPGGNLGNSSAFGKAFSELKELGLIDRIPRLAVINAQGANTLHELHVNGSLAWNGGRFNQSQIDAYYENAPRPSTLASAIEINVPVNLSKCLRAIDICDGVVREVPDEEILDAKAQVGAGGFGCEPASGASVAGARLLRQQGVIAPSDRVVCILTGHQLKDPNVTVGYHSTSPESSTTDLASRGINTKHHSNPARRIENNLDCILDEIQSFDSDS